jgi:hypothetical protein
MKIRLNQEIPPRVVAALAYSVFLFLCSLFVYVLVDSGRDWVSVFFIKQVARIHLHQHGGSAFREIWPSFLREQIRYDLIDRKYVFYDEMGDETVQLYDDGRVFFPGTVSY